MITFREDKLFREPLKIREMLTGNGAEMSELQLAMLCGLIREYQPKKIVEVGVAAGGTTAVLLNCISALEMDTEIYAVDISENYYRDTSKRTGYLMEEYNQISHNKVKCKFTGGGICRSVWTKLEMK